MKKFLRLMTCMLLTGCAAVVPQDYASESPKLGDRYIGSAADVIGEAQGVAAGNALQWRYVLKLPDDIGGYQMNMDDWMWMIDDKTLANRTTMSKLGVAFAGITIFFRKR